MRSMLRKFSGRRSRGLHCEPGRAPHEARALPEGRWVSQRGHKRVAVGEAGPVTEGEEEESLEGGAVDFSLDDPVSGSGGADPV